MFVENRNFVVVSECMICYVLQIVAHLVLQRRRYCWCFSYLSHFCSDFSQQSCASRSCLLLHQTTQYVCLRLQACHFALCSCCYAVAFVSLALLIHPVAWWLHIWLVLILVKWWNYTVSRKLLLFIVTSYMTIICLRSEEYALHVFHNYLLHLVDQDRTDLYCVTWGIKLCSIYAQLWIILFHCLLLWYGCHVLIVFWRCWCQDWCLTSNKKCFRLWPI